LGKSIDVFEIDAASNTGVDNIRELRESAKMRPRNRYKIFIIDEVHVLSTLHSMPCSRFWKATAAR
jgi:DNA polymerase-3 subunit gamma/tau